MKNANFATRLVTTAGALIMGFPVAPANAEAVVTYRQKQVCEQVAAQPAHNVGFIRVGNQVQQFNVDARAAYERCHWVTDEAGRTVTHNVAGPNANF